MTLTGNADAQPESLPVTVMLSHATKKFSTVANGQKAFPLCLRSFDRATTNWLDIGPDYFPPTALFALHAPQSNAPPGSGSWSAF